MAPYEKLDERKKLTKALKQKALMIEAKELNAKETTDFTINLAKSENKMIDTEAAEHLVLLANGHLSSIYQEIQNSPPTPVTDMRSHLKMSVSSSQEVWSRIFLS